MERSIVLKQNQGFLLNDKVNIAYYSGIDHVEGFLLLSKTPVLFTDARYFLAVKEQLANSEIRPLLFNGLEDVKKEIEKQKIEKLFIDYSLTSLKDYKEYKKFGVKIKDGEKILTLNKSVKNKEEISCIKKACEITEKAFYYTLKKVKEGMTELEFKKILVDKMKSLGATDESFETIVAFNKGSAIPHYQTGNVVLKKNMPILCDTGCIYNGYMSDFTRTVYFGTPDKKFIECYNSVLKAQLKAIEEIKAGYTLKQADAVARDSLKKDKLDKYFTHSLGHGIGREIHEYPSLSPKKEGKLKLKQVFSIEPGVYFDNQFGIRIEDTVVLYKSGIKPLFNDSKELLIIN